MINALELYRQIKDQWDTTSQPLKERGIPGQEFNPNGGLSAYLSPYAIADTFAPVGTYEDGRMGPALPKALTDLPPFSEFVTGIPGAAYDMVAGLAGSTKRLMDSDLANTPVNDDAAWSQMGRDSFDAAGLATTGALGVGLAMDDVVKAAPKIVSSAVPNAVRTEPHRLHASPYQFDKFDPSFSGASVDTGGNGGYKGAFFLGEDRISGPEGYWTDRVREIYNRASVYETDISPEANVLNMTLPFQDLPDNVRQTLLQNEDLIRNNWAPNIHAMRFGGQKYDVLNPEHQAAYALTATRNNRLQAIENLRYGVDEPSLIDRFLGREHPNIAAAKLIEGGYNGRADLFNPDSSLGELYAGITFPEKIDKMGFNVAILGDETVVMDPNLLRIKSRTDLDGAPHGTDPAVVEYMKKIGSIINRKDETDLYSNAPTGSSVPLAMNALEKAQPQGIRAYHGSPHDFDRFSLDKIGTGEGAQAYGHGLYFAENEGVARSYRDTISQVQESRVSNATEAFAKTAVDTNGGDVKKAIEYAKKRASDGGPRSNEWSAAVEFLNTYTPNKGRMYEVNIKANPEDFLDWDKPLGQQSEVVRNALKQRFASDPIRQRDMEFDGGNSLMSYILRNESGPDTTQALREAGIPGIRYLDSMSRGAGQGSSNYVVFDDQLVDILRKYANAPTGSVIPAGMQASPQETDPALIEYLRLTGQIPY